VQSFVSIRMKLLFFKRTDCLLKLLISTSAFTVIHSQKKYESCHWDRTFSKGKLLSILSANMYILCVNMSILGAIMYILGAIMYILGVNMYILGANM